MLTFGEPGTDDHCSHRGLIQNPAGGHIGDGDFIFPGNRIQNPEDLLKFLPAACLVNEPLILHLAPVMDPGQGWFFLTQPAVRPKSAGHRSIGEEFNPMLQAQSAHLCQRTPVQEGYHNLIADDRNPFLKQEMEMIGIEIRQPQMADDSLFL